MTKRIMTMFVLLALAVGLYMTANAKGDGGERSATQMTQPTRPATSTARPATCKIKTGIEGGTVNLRSCAGTSCGVLDIVTEGESLDIVQAGLWMNVKTNDGVTGWLNSKYCKYSKEYKGK